MVVSTSYERYDTHTTRTRAFTHSLTQTTTYNNPARQIIFLSMSVLRSRTRLNAHTAVMRFLAFSLRFRTPIFKTIR